MLYIWYPHSVSILLRPINYTLNSYDIFLGKYYLFCMENIFGLLDVSSSHVRKSTCEKMSFQLAQ
jgi:hypothetical protein